MNVTHSKDTLSEELPISFLSFSKEHGYYAVGRSLQTIMMSGHGPWNDETLLRGSIEMGKNIQELDVSQPWGCLSCLVGESLMPPSTFKAFVQQTIIRKSKGLTGLAVVIQNSDISNTIKQQLTQAYESAGIDFAFLATIDLAMDWLREKDIKMEQASVKQFYKQNTFSPD
jgi:hypothetical protein